MHRNGAFAALIVRNPVLRAALVVTLLASAPARAESAAKPAEDEASGAAADGDASDDAAGAAAEPGATESGATESEATESEAAASSEAAPSEGEASSEAAERLDGLALRVGWRVAQRALTFHDALNELVPGRPVLRPLRNHKSDRDMAVVARAELYPAALAGVSDYIANFGLVGELRYGVPSETIYRGAAGSVTLKNEELAWFAGARLRVPLSDDFRLGFGLGYGQHRYTLKGDESDPLVPDVHYSYVLPAVDLRAAFGRFFIDAKVGARALLDSGMLEDWFENVGAHGVEGELTVGYQLTRALAIVVGGQVEYYAFSFKPLALRATRVAGGATDRYLGGFAALELRLGGTQP